MCTERHEAGKGLVVADVIQPCSNTSHLEVIADVTMIRSSMPFDGGRVLNIHPVTHNQ